ncbi:hypothetical protein Salat_2608300 [Sesamum alatum]|uniref:Uncharacterized protein n=1 Tax=Sesamum alatum TaxID=300844 RepID=A0AAE1XN87_9LAMI|nr:hypothetical protein Salat_2608300 [Sesamum alatum]
MCEHCRKPGYLEEKCFKLHDTPDWCKELSEKRKKSGGKGRNFVAAIENGPAPVPANQLQGTSISDLLRNEIRRMLIEEVPAQHEMRTPFDNIRTNCVRLEEIDESTVQSYFTYFAITNCSFSYPHIHFTYTVTSLTNSCNCPFHS